MDYSTLILVVSLVLLSSISSATFKTLTKGSSLHVEKPDHVLISPNGVFSAGFHSVGTNTYLFAIWFTKSSPRTLVWMANRDQPVNGRGSILSLLKDGNLVLIDGGRINLFSTNTFSSSSVQLDLFDNGNLVLHTLDGFTLWQSFDAPTDTLLPYQALTKDSTLVSSKSATNYSAGYYKFFFDNDNVLRLGYDGPDQFSSVYWPDPWLLSWDAGRSWVNSTRIAVFNSSGYFSSSDKLEFSSSDMSIGPQRRLTLDYDGNLRMYSLDENIGTWIVSWVAFRQPCKIHGVCGSNSLCAYDGHFGGSCSCLPGFKMKNPHDWFLGCEPNFNISNNKNEKDDFMQINHVDLYGYNYLEFKENTLERCKEICLNLSDCKGFQYRPYIVVSSMYLCYPKKLLRNSYQSPSFEGDFYLRIPKSSLKPYNQPAERVRLDCSVTPSEQRLNRTYTQYYKHGSLKLLLWFACALGCVEIICILLVWCFLYRTNKKNSGYNLAAIGFRKFTYTELKKATKNFKDEIGRGGTGIVYRGTLSDNRVAAIKQLNDMGQQGEAEFLAEVSSIGRLNHINLIDMYGYCADGKHRLLVYEYMELGSLAENLVSEALDWDKRFNIAVGMAKGLAYLHEECLEWVLHCDVKPQNILLDDNYQPKVADFGLSKLLNRGGEKGSSFSKMRGTRGYMAPEWVLNLPITSKVDVYSYGIVVLEMVTRKNPIGVQAVNGGEISHKTLVTWVREKVMNESWLEEIIDPQLEEEIECVSDRIKLLVKVALHCVEDNMEARPTMSKVVEMLQYR